MKKGALCVEVPQVHVAVLLVEVAPEPMLIALLSRRDGLLGANGRLIHFEGSMCDRRSVFPSH